MSILRIPSSSSNPYLSYLQLLQTSAAAQAAFAMDHPRPSEIDLFAALLHAQGGSLIPSQGSQRFPADQNVNTLA